VCSLTTVHCGATLRGSGLYNASIVGRVVVVLYSLLDNAAFALRPLCVARDLGWCDHDYPRWDAHNALDSTGSIPYTCSAHRLLSWGRSSHRSPPWGSDS